ncbi:hypothetical protein JKP88DRAFT_161157 [Tribonema minus]|uniref:RING-type domain-containing protein n=1 Tax=Tribonema minus TaxID=303371 RepID=A0A835Z7S2_9STRA|nr:hypothetical protein JKP88DRAFT_161157 [Tribonema minus]
MQCGVCLMDYRPGDELCRLPCPSQHVYHATCITMWLDAHVTCPYCKFNLIQQAHELV